VSLPTQAASSRASHQPARTPLNSRMLIGSLPPLSTLPEPQTTKHRPFRARSFVFMEFPQCCVRRALQHASQLEGSHITHPSPSCLLPRSPGSSLWTSHFWTIHENQAAKSPVNFASLCPPRDQHPRTRDSRTAYATSQMGICVTFVLEFCSRVVRKISQEAIVHCRNNVAIP